MGSLAFRSLNFHDLNTSEIYDLLQLRSRVFVLEQNCVFLDMDDLDQKAIHNLGYSAGNLATYTRVHHDPRETHRIHIGRVIVAKDFRGKKLSYEAMNQAIHLCRDISPEKEIFINAQLHLQRLYKNLGFRPISAPYLLDGIQHLDMVL